MLCVDEHEWQRSLSHAADQSTSRVERHQQRSIQTPAQLRFAEEALLLFVTVAKLRPANRGRELADAGALMLNNHLVSQRRPGSGTQRRVAARAGVLGIAGSPSNALKAAVVSRRERINDVGIAMSPIFRADAIFAEPSSDHSTRPERLPGHDTKDQRNYSPAH